MPRAGSRSDDKFPSDKHFTLTSFASSVKSERTRAYASAVGTPNGGRPRSRRSGPAKGTACHPVAPSLPQRRPHHARRTGRRHRAGRRAAIRPSPRPPEAPKSDRARRAPAASEPPRPHTAADRYPLRESHRGAGAHAEPLGQQARRAHHEIRGIVGHAGVVGRHRDVAGGPHEKRVVKVDRLEDRPDLVVSVARRPSTRSARFTFAGQRAVRHAPGGITVAPTRPLPTRSPPRGEAPRSAALRPPVGPGRCRCPPRVAAGLEALALDAKSLRRPLRESRSTSGSPCAVLPGRRDHLASAGHRIGAPRASIGRALPSGRRPRAAPR